MRVALLNGSRLNFDGNLSFNAIKEVAVELIVFEKTQPSEVVKRAQSCDVLISKELPLTKETIKSLPGSVSLLCEAGTGTDNIDIKTAKAQSIQVCNVPNYSTPHVGQLTLNFILSLSSGLFKRTRNGSSSGSLNPAMISEVEGKTLGVLGAGNIGKEVIRLALVFGMKIRVYNRTTRFWNNDNIKQVSLDEVLSSSDFLTLHCPLQKDSRHLIQSDTLRKMKRGAYIINTARGGLINHDDLVKFLLSGDIAGAALDVQEPEPLPLSSPLRAMDNVILTDHIGWKSIEARTRLIKGVAENIRKYGETGTPLNLVNQR